MGCAKSKVWCIDRDLGNCREPGSAHLWLPSANCPDALSDAPRYLVLRLLRGTEASEEIQVVFSKVEEGAA